MNNEIALSSLAHTWIIDLDGTIVEHNGYKEKGHDVLIDGAMDFLESIPKEDMIIFLTSRTLECKDQTLRFLDANGIRHDQIIFCAPFGERILVNDLKPSGLKTSIAINKQRNSSQFVDYVIDSSL